MNVTINDVTIDHATDLTTLKNGQLNQLLGENGAPKYSTNQMKGKTKNQLVDECQDVVNDAAKAQKPKKVRAAGTGTGKGAVQRVSKNVDSAASKKCNWLKYLVAGKKTAEQATEMYAFDSVLQLYWKQEQFVADIAAALKGERPKAGKTMVQLTVDLDA